jgi:hypothetical protein
MGRRRVTLWSETLGSYGAKVTVCERTLGGPLSLRYWDTSRPRGANWTWRSLHHADRERGRQQARELAGRLLAVGLAVREKRLTVAELLTRYTRDVSPHKKGKQPIEDARRATLWRAFLGDPTEVRGLDFPTVDRFVRERRAGRIVLKEHTWVPRPLIQPSGRI